MKVMSAPKTAAQYETRGSAEDEWGMFDPQQAGMPAVMRLMQDDDRRDAAPTDVDWAAPLAQVAVAHANDSEWRPPEATTSIETPAPARKSLIGAVYTMESAARCPQCEKEIRTFRVLRVLRTQVSFTSTLPRKGYVVVCPECDQILSAELSGVI